MVESLNSDIKNYLCAYLNSVYILVATEWKDGTGQSDHIENARSMLIPGGKMLLKLFHVLEHFSTKFQHFKKIFSLISAIFS